MAAASAGSERLKGEEVLKNQLKICGFKKDDDVTELYLGERGLKEVPDLSQFHILMYLWLNNNKIEKLTFLKHNCCLRELYLNNNEIKNIAGALRHVHSLQILLLHNNQLKNLETTVNELKGMMSLQTLKITTKERSLALNIYNHKKTLVLQSIGFGKRIDVPLLPKAQFNKIWSFTKVLRLPPGCEFGNHLVKIPFENPEDAVFVRAMKRSIMEFSTVNWDKVPTSEEKRLGTKPEKKPEKLTIKFR
ncbi:leucine-rich repeat-containing protein 72 isoform X2 [Eublepharis macularius]|uniref:Leucine-rich repeat-containing protein 72 isoform X2 n=1 Tax=Eublepharis macularius TaxID=481883 RepID=A0AA97JYW3_EUBMA|nr:leucine-rich repeat-containing protein 72 isoform X2 [Eublepharis macularius]